MRHVYVFRDFQKAWKDSRSYIEKNRIINYLRIDRKKLGN